MENKSLYELGKLAQKGNDMALLEIIERKKKMIKKYSFGDEDRYQFIILKLIEGIKNYKFQISLELGENFINILTVYIVKGKFKESTI